jgi:two-component system, OmpR family, response regulator
VRIENSVNVLIIEDDASLGKAIERGVLDAGLSCAWARNGEDGLLQAMSGVYEVVILDLMLPDVSGHEVLQRLRSAGLTVPVMILTALGSVEDKVKGLEKGADDYMVKPFAMVEMLARLKALARRSHVRPSTELTLGGINLDLTNRKVRRDGKELVLTPTEFSLLEYLMRFSGEVVTRKMLCEHLWAAEWEGITNVVEVHINRLRGKLDKGFNDTVIHTVRGRGYMFRPA